jgi:hypothetical protein
MDEIDRMLKRARKRAERSDRRTIATFRAVQKRLIARMDACLAHLESRDPELIIAEWELARLRNGGVHPDHTLH